MIEPLTFDELRSLREDGPVNVFMLDHDPALAARAHVDRHVVKMILETAQLLSTAWHCLSNEAWFPLADDPADDPAETVTPWIANIVHPACRDGSTPRPVFKAEGEVPYAHWELFSQKVYTRTHQDHPSAVWARSLGGNYSWLWKLGIALCDEYKYRYGKTHATLPVLWTLEALPPPLVESAGQWDEAPPVMPEEVRVVRDGYYDAVSSYRNYYANSKVRLYSWTRRGPPAWLKVPQNA